MHRFRKLQTITLILLFLLLEVSLARLVSSSPANNTVPNPSQGASALQIELSTTSDWSTATFTGLGKALVTQYAIVEGGAAPGLAYDPTPTAIAVSKADQTTRVTIRVQTIFLNMSSQITLSVNKGNAGNTTVTLYRWSGGQFTAYKTYTKGNFAITSNELFPSQVPAPLEALPSDVNKIVLADMYPWFHSPYGPSGYSDWSNSTDGNATSASCPYWPIFGAYDSWDLGLTDAQILLAKQAGIDGFLCSWDDSSGMTGSLDRLMTEAASLGFKIGIYYEDNRTPAMNATQIENELIYYVNRYSGSPAFLTAGGRPVIFCYVSAGLTPAQWQTVRAGVEASVGRIFLVLDCGSYHPEFAPVFDGYGEYLGDDVSNSLYLYNQWTTYCSMSASDLDFNSTLAEMQNTGQLQLYQKLIVGTATPGLNKPSTGEFVDRNSGTLYQRAWQAIGNSSLGAAMITSWDELREGTNIQPDTTNGFRELTTTRAQVAAFKGVTIPQLVGTPVLQYTTSAVDNQLKISIKNTGSAPAVAVRVETDLGATINAKVVSSSPYLTKYSSIVNYIMLIQQGQSAKVTINFSGVPKSSMLINSLAVKGYAVDGTAVTITASNITPPPAGKSNVGVIVGLIIAVIVIGLAVYWLLSRRRKPPAPTAGSTGPTA